MGYIVIGSKPDFDSGSSGSNPDIPAYEYKEGKMCKQTQVEAFIMAQRCVKVFKKRYRVFKHKDGIYRETGPWCWTKLEDNN